MSARESTAMARLRATHGDHVADAAAAVVAGFPPLTPEQVAKLRALFAVTPERKSA